MITNNADRMSNAHTQPFNFFTTLQLFSMAEGGKNKRDRVNISSDFFRVTMYGPPAFGTENKKEPALIKERVPATYTAGANSSFFFS